MTLPEYTLRLLQERYSEAAMREWREATRPVHMPWGEVPWWAQMTESMKPFGRALAQFGALVGGLGQTRVPLSPLTLRLLEELYGGIKCPGS